MADCLFCKMVRKEITPDIVYEDNDVLAFKDIRPQAPIHILVIPKKHIATLNDLQAEDAELMGKIFFVAKEVAKQVGIDQSGFRTVFNCNRDAGQEVYHIHLHLLGGRKMTWPPG